MPVTPRSLRRNQTSATRFGVAVLAGAVGVGGAAWSVMNFVHPYANNMAKGSDNFPDLNVPDIAPIVSTVTDAAPEAPAADEAPVVDDGLEGALATVAEPVTTAITPIASHGDDGVTPPPPGGGGPVPPIVLPPVTPPTGVQIPDVNVAPPPSTGLPVTVCTATVQPEGATGSTVEAVTQTAPAAVTEPVDAACEEGAEPTDSAGEAEPAVSTPLAAAVPTAG